MPGLSLAGAACPNRTRFHLVANCQMNTSAEKPPGTSAKILPDRSIELAWSSARRTSVIRCSHPGGSRSKATSIARRYSAMSFICRLKAPRMRASSGKKIGTSHAHHGVDFELPEFDEVDFYLFAQRIVFLDGGFMLSLRNPVVRPARSESHAASSVRRISAWADY